jgi:hypothetical protein
MIVGRKPIMTRRKALRISGRVFILLLLTGLLVGLGCADRLILGENHERVDAHGARAMDIDVRGRRVECWVARSPGALQGREPQAFVLFFVGKGDRVERWINVVAGAWGERPVEVWGMNYPGSGGSDGPVRLADVGPDALAVYDAVRRVAGSRPQLIIGHYGWWNLWAIAGPASTRVPADLDSIANAAKVTAPAIFISAGADGVIPAKYHRMVIDAYAGRKRVIEMPDGAHDSPLTREAAGELRKDMDWLWETGKGSSIDGK